MHAPNIKASKPAKPRSGPTDAEGLSLRDRLKNIFHSRKTITAGSIQLIGLDALREQIGSRWSIVRDKVHVYIQRILLNRLKPQDAWFRYGDDGYILVFAHLDNQAAQLLCGKLLEEIHRCLLGDPATERISVTSVAFDVGGDITLESADLADLLAAVAKGADKAEGERRATDGAGRPPLPAPAAVEALSHAHNVEEKVEALRAAVAPFTPNSPTHVVFRPVWDVASAVFSTYRCVAARSSDRFNTIADYDTLPDPEDTDAIFDLDCDTMSKSVAIASELYANNFRYISCIPIHFESFANSKRRTDYIELLKVIPRHLIPFVEFIVHGLPAGVPQGRILAIRSFLSPHCRLIIPFINIDNRAVAVYAQSGMKLIGTRIPPLLPESEAQEHIRGYAHAGRKHGLTTYMGGIRSPALFEVACDAGVRLLSGPFFGPDTDYPQHMRRIGKEELLHQAEIRQEHLRLA